MKTAVIGVGAVGGYFGGKIAHAGNDVTFVARGATLLALRENGLQVNSTNGDFRVETVKATDNLQEIQNADLIILGVKAWQVAGIAHDLQPYIHDHTIILPLQNGVMAYDEIAGEIGKSHVLGGLCRIFSKIESPGIISHQGIEPSVVFGEMDNTKTDRTRKIRDFLIQSGIKSRIADDIQSELWKKFINICASGLLAVTRSTYGEIRELEETRELMTELFEEIYAISRIAGIQIEHDFINKTIAFIDTFPYDSTSSLTRDVWEGKPSELEYQNGTVVRLGEKYGIKTPVNRFIYYCLLNLEKKARAKPIDV